MLTPIDYAKRIAYSSEETLMFTYEQAKKYADKDGVYVECGVAAGAQIIAMAYGAPNKTIYAFDSFEGIPLPSNRDDQMPGIMMLTEAEQKALPDPGKQKLESSGATVVSLEDFIKNIDSSLGVVSVYEAGVRTFIKTKNQNDLDVGTKVDSGVILAYKGWFENRLPGFLDPISILRLDGDLYNSTYVCLKNLYPKVIEGGLIIIDDWELKGCRDAFYDYFNNQLNPYESPFIKYVSNIAYFYK